MKKWIVFALALVVVLTLAACNKHTSDAPGVTTTPTQSAPTSPTQTAPTAPTTAPTQSTPTTIPTTTPTTTPTAPICYTTQQPKLRSFRVEGIKEDGMILHMGTNTYLYVKSDMKVYIFDTVYMTYLDSDIKQQSGKFTDYSGKELEYTYVLENVLNIRFPESGEPTYG